MAKPLIAAAPEMGHNAPRPRLDLLAEDARKGLARVAKGEAEAIAGWLIYGAALNEGRALFPKGDNARFSDWLSSSQLANCSKDDRAAAMWAAGDRATFDEMRTAHPRVRTVRGLHAKWREAENARKAEESRRVNAAARRRAEGDQDGARRRATAIAEADAASASSAQRGERVLRAVTDDDAPPPVPDRPAIEDIEITPEEFDMVADKIVHRVCYLAEGPFNFGEPGNADFEQLAQAVARGGTARKARMVHRIRAAIAFLMTLEKEIEP